MLIIIKTVVKIVWIGISVVMLVMGACIIRVNTQGTKRAAGLILLLIVVCTYMLIPEFKKK